MDFYRIYGGIGGIPLKKRLDLTPRSRLLSVFAICRKRFCRRLKGITLVEIVLALGLLILCTGILLSGFIAAGGMIVRGRDNEAAAMELSAAVERFIADPNSLDTNKYEYSVLYDQIDGVNGKYYEMRDKEHGFRYRFFVAGA